MRKEDNVMGVHMKKNKWSRASKMINNHIRQHRALET